MLGEINNLSGAAVTAGVSGNVDTGRYSLSGIRPDGSFSLKIVITGDGTATISYKTAEEPGGTYTAPQNGATLITGLDEGTYSIPFSPLVTKNIKFNVLETGASSTITAQITLIAS